MEIKRKYTFKADVWILTAYKGQAVIGRTFFRNGEPCVMLITEDARAITVDFDEMQLIRKMVLPLLLPSISTTIQTKKRKTLAEQQISETITLINKQ